MTSRPSCRLRFAASILSFAVLLLLAAARRGRRSVSAMLGECPERNQPDCMQAVCVSYNASASSWSCLKRPSANRRVCSMYDNTHAQPI